MTSASGRYALLLPEAFLPDGSLAMSAPLFIRRGEILLSVSDDEDLVPSCLRTIASLYPEPRELNLMVVKHERNK